MNLLRFFFLRGHKDRDQLIDRLTKKEKNLVEIPGRKKNEWKYKS